jgi:hypothetical protein
MMEKTFCWDGRKEGKKKIINICDGIEYVRGKSNVFPLDVLFEKLWE